MTETDYRSRGLALEGRVLTAVDADLVLGVTKPEATAYFQDPPFSETRDRQVSTAISGRRKRGAAIDRGSRRRKGQSPADS